MAYFLPPDLTLKREAFFEPTEHLNRDPPVRQDASQQTPEASVAPVAQARCQAPEGKRRSQLQCGKATKSIR